MKYIPVLLVYLVTLLYPSRLDASPWPIHGHVPQNTNFSPRGQSISRRNIARLHALWTITGASQAVAAGTMPTLSRQLEFGALKGR